MFLMKAQGAKAMPLITHTLLYEINGDWTARLNMLSTVLDGEGANAKNLARKYFRMYAYRPSQIKLILNYLHKYPHNVNFKGLIKYKQYQLQQSLKALKSKQWAPIDSTTVKQNPSATSKLVAKYSTYNFGTRSNIGSAIHTFILTNEGKNPVQIGKVTTSCGCTVAKAPSEKTIKPGGQVKIPVSVDLTSKNGVVKEQVMIQTNEPDHSVVHLYITGKVDAK